MMNNILEISGILGSICFIVSFLPLSYHAFKNKTAKGVSLYFILLLLTGAVCSSIYAIFTSNYVLLPNFIFSVIGTSVVFYYKIMDKIKCQK